MLQFGQRVHCSSDRSLADINVAEPPPRDQRRVPASATHASSERHTKMLNHGAYAARTSLAWDSRMPDSTIDPPTLTRADNAGASIINGYARMFASTTSNDGHAA